jgi:plasmid maintenance system killer protein
LSALQVNDFWDANPTEETAGKDGIEWMLESRINKQYHCIERWDNGRLASNPISLYLSDLMTIGNSILPMKSSR